MRIPVPRLSLLSLLVAIAGSSPADAAPSVAEVIAAAPHAAQDAEAIVQGKTAVDVLKEVSDRELALGVACLVEGDPKTVLAPFLGDQPMTPQTEGMVFGKIRAASSEQDLRSLALGNEAAAESRRYLNAEPSYELNLSLTEIEGFNQLGETDHGGQTVHVVEGRVRGQLLERFRVYQKGGAGALPAYARPEGSESTPADELHSSLVLAGTFPELLPEFQHAWAKYPHATPTDAREHFFWERVSLEGRPLLALSHRLALFRPGIASVGERDFYFSHFFDAALTTATVIDVAEGQLFVFTHRVWVDHWSGLSSLKRSVGHKLIKKLVAGTVHQLGICP